MINKIMQRFHITFFLIFSLLLNVWGYRAFSYPPIVTETGQISDNLYHLCKLYHDHPDTAGVYTNSQSLPEKNAPLDTWNQWLQDHFIRPKGRDHQDLLTTPLHPAHEAMLPLFEKLGMVKESGSTIRKQYDICVIFGGSPWETEERINWVFHLIHTGVRFNKVIYINGRRPLYEVEQKYMQEHYGVDYQNTAASQAQQHIAAEHIWHSLCQSGGASEKDDKLAELESQFELLTLDSPRDEKGEILRRINTEDTLKAFFFQRVKEGKTHESAFFVTNNPYGPYQGDTVFKVQREQPEFMQIPVEVSFSGVHSPRSTMVYLDSIARRLYTILH